MADNFTVLDSSGSTVTFRSTDVGLGVECTMSIPTNKLGTAMIGQATMATSIPVVIASDQTTLTTIISALPNPITAVVSGTVTAIVPNPTTAVITGTPAVSLTAIGGTAVVIGQAVMTASIPVVLASNQSNLTTVIASLPNPITAVVSGTVTAVVPNPTTAVITNTPSVSLTAIGGTAVVIGQAVMTASIPVVLASNQSNLTTVIASLPNPITAVVSGTVTAVVPNPTTAVITNTPLVNLTAVGGAAVTLGSLTAASSIPVALPSNQIVSASITNVGGAAVATGGLSGLLAVGGATASGSPVSGNPLASGGRSQTAEQATTAAGSLMAVSLDITGKAIVQPYSNKENFKSGTIAVNTTSTTSLIAAANSTNRLYITSLYFGNTAATLTRVTFNDVSASVFVVPGTASFGLSFPVPLVFTTGTAVVIQYSTATVTGYISAQGYFGV